MKWPNEKIKPLITRAREDAAVVSATTRVIKKQTHYGVTGHPHVKLFEAAISKRLGRSNALGVDSGTNALLLALHAAGIGPGDEVIVPAFSFIATATVVSWVGAKPVFVDICEDDYAIDPQKVPGCITDRTRAIIVAHLFGQPSSRMKEILTIVEKHHILLIEDCAQSFGARVHVDNTWSTVGSLGDFGCFSFSSTKPFSAPGNAGAVASKDAQALEKIDKMRFYGIEKNNTDYRVVGVCAKLHDLHAAALLAKFPFLDYWSGYTQALSEIYDRMLPHKLLKLPLQKVSGTERVWYQYTVRTGHRDQLFDVLKNEAGGNGWLYPLINYPRPLPYLTVFKKYIPKDNTFPISTKIANEIISLPLNKHIDKQDVLRIARVTKDVLTTSP